MTTTGWGGVAVLVVSLVGCDSGVRSRSDGGACFTVDRPDLDFGEIDVGTTGISRVNVTNRMDFDIYLAVNTDEPFSAQPATLILAPAARGSPSDAKGCSTSRPRPSSPPR